MSIKKFFWRDNSERFMFFKTLIYSMQISIYASLVVYYLLGAISPCSPIISILNHFSKPIFYCTGQTITNPIESFMTGGAHPLSWSFLFLFSLVVRLLIPSGNTYKTLVINAILSFLIPAFLVGLNEFIWDLAFMAFAFYVTPAPIFWTRIIWILEGFLTLGAPLGLTGALLGVYFRFYKLFNKKIFVTTILIFIFILGLWISYGFPLSNEIGGKTNLTANVFESLHWSVVPIGGILAIIFSKRDLSKLRLQIYEQSK